jgi:hypothetical protein
MEKVLNNALKPMEVLLIGNILTGMAVLLTGVVWFIQRVIVNELLFLIMITMNDGRPFGFGRPFFGIPFLGGGAAGLLGSDFMLHIDTAILTTHTHILTILIINIVV